MIELIGSPITSLTTNTESENTHQFGRINYLGNSNFNIISNQEKRAKNDRSIDGSLSYKATKESTLIQSKLLESDILKICKKCSEVIGALIFVSPSKELESMHRLRYSPTYTPDSYKELKETFNSHNGFHKKWCNEIYNQTAKKGLIEKQIANLRFALKSHIGNCNLMALMSATLLKSILEDRLKSLGHSKESIEKLNYKLSILSSDNHNIALLSLTLNNELIEYIIDPWSDGAVFPHPEIKEFYKNTDSGWSHTSEFTSFYTEPNDSELCNNKEYNDAFKHMMLEMCGINLYNAYASDPLINIK